jgi:1,2-diacylglycerol 3-beta-galactosyltransferase
VRRIPVITVITDLVDVHAAWASAEVDAVVIPSLGGLDRCRRAGIPARRCHDLGLPVDPAFTAPLPNRAERAQLRERLGLDASGFVVLVCGGADGSGGIARRARALAAAALDVELVVICGRNLRARRRLDGLRDWRGRPVAVHGFVRNMAEWMRAADVVATKAGPGTIAEALCCGVPLLLTCYIPGQERGNVEWLSDIGAGRFVPRLDQLVDTVAELAEPASPALAAMRTVVRRVARPEATARIAELVATLANGERLTRVSLAPPA